MERVAPVGLWMVSASQISYVIGSFTQPGGPGLGAIASAASAGCAAVGASGLSRGDRTTFAWSLAVFLAVQGLDYLTSLSLSPFFIGFTLLIIGLVAMTSSALRWRTQGADVPRPNGVRFGAGVASLGAFSYLVAGFLIGANFGVFTVGALAAGIGWALVALT